MCEVRPCGEEQFIDIVANGHQWWTSRSFLLLSVWVLATWKFVFFWVYSTGSCTCYLVIVLSFLMKAVSVTGYYLGYSCECGPVFRHGGRERTSVPTAWRSCCRKECVCTVCCPNQIIILWCIGFKMYFDVVNAFCVWIQLTAKFLLQLSAEQCWFWLRWVLFCSDAETDRSFECIRLPHCPRRRMAVFLCSLCQVSEGEGCKLLPGFMQRSEHLWWCCCS